MGVEAMKEVPKIGLDAFCQKVLIYQAENDSVYVAFNNISDFGKLYYGKTNDDQRKVTLGMKAMITKAVSSRLKKLESRH